MGIFNSVQMLPNLLMNKCSSAFLASFDSMFATGVSVEGVVKNILRIIIQLFYFACKWIMYVVDVIYFYILELVGISADTSVLEAATNDMTFRFILDNKDQVFKIVKNLIVMAIILLIVTTIIAIIKQQAVALTEKKAKGAVGDVFKKTFKAFILLAVTPLIAIFGIFASSVLLRTLFNATNLSQAKSLSARVFNAAATNSNKYKMYADSGTRIPIKYNFTKDNKADAIEYTAHMLQDSCYPDFSLFNETTMFIDTKILDPVLKTDIEKSSKYNSATETWLNDVYYNYYDTSLKYNPNSNEGNQYKILVTHANEYYVMSDFIGYALDTMEEFYYITIQEMLDSVASFSENETENQNKLKELMQGYNVKLISNGQYEATKKVNRPNGNGSEFIIGYDGINWDYAEIYNAFKHGYYSYIEYTSQYEDGEHTYVHVKDAVDELEGAKFVVAYRKSAQKTYQNNLNGKFYKNGSNYEEVETYFYKNPTTNKYQKVQLYFYYDSIQDKFVKEKSFSDSKTYYYKFGDDFKQIEPEDKTRFYFKTKSGNYQNLTFGNASNQLYEEVVRYCYAPLAKDVAVDENISTFDSEYIKSSSIITARGLFDNDLNPTAMRRLSNGDIMFYRDNLEVVAEGSVADVATIEEIEAETGDEKDSSGVAGFFKKAAGAVKNAFNKVVNSVKKFVSSIFNPSRLIPEIFIDKDAMSKTYTNVTEDILTIQEGKIHISYFFADNITSSLLKRMSGININYLFEPSGINIVILIFGSIVFFKVCITAVFSLMQRALNMVLLIMIYPIACSTLPIDATGKKGNDSYGAWVKKFKELLFSTYGMILAINFVFLLLPVIDKLEFITPERLSENKAAARIGTALSNPWMLLGIDVAAFKPNFHLISSFMNWLLRIICEIAAFSFIAPMEGKGGETFYSSIQRIVGTPSKLLEESPVKAVKDTVKKMTHTFNMIFFPQLVIKDKIKSIKSGAAGFVKNLPPVSLVQEKSARYNEMKNERNKENIKKDLMSALNNKAPVEEVKKKIKNFNDAFGTKIDVSKVQKKDSGSS